MKRKRANEKGRDEGEKKRSGEGKGEKKGERAGLAKEVENDRNVKGEMAELRFLERVTALGYVACRPFGNNARFDFLVEARGRISRVQVKSSWERRRPYADYRVRVVSGAHGKKRRYEATEIDFVAAYAAPDDAWYIVPVRALPKYHSIRVFPKEGARGRYERYREGWELLERGRNSSRVERIWACAEEKLPAAGGEFSVEGRGTGEREEREEDGMVIRAAVEAEAGELSRVSQGG